MRTWIEPNDQLVPEEWRSEFDLSDIVTKTLLRRGFSSLQDVREFLEPDSYVPASPFDLPGMETAVDLLTRALNLQEGVCIWGDYDVDGQTATSVLQLALENLGIKTFSYVPVRATESHGINQKKLEKIIHGKRLEGGTSTIDYRSVQILLTCDTGISANSEIDYALSQGIDVIVTDHHELPPLLPKADAIINPKLLPANHPLSALPGVGVAYKLVEALYNRCDLMPNQVEEFLDLVALGIVADLALLHGDTRYLLQKGLRILRETKRPGLLEIARQAEIDLSLANEELIGYEIAPRLNAIGRLGDANKAVTLLTTKENAEARRIALEIEGMNNHRKLITNQVFQAAVSQVERDPELLKHPALILFHPDWPAGILGICASRLVERYHLPAILIQANRSEPGRGSARSIEGFNITELLQENENYLLSYGGHALAAGFSIDSSKIEDFRQSMFQSIQKLGVPSAPALYIDANISLSDLQPKLASELERLGPFGPGNPPVVLKCQNLSVILDKTIGRQAEHRLVTVSNEQNEHQKIIWWQGAGYPLPESKFDLAVTVRSTNYQGIEQLQVEWIEARTSDREISLGETARQTKYYDFRNENNPIQILENFLKNESGVIWAESDTTRLLSKHDFRFVSRIRLYPAETLIVWTIPAHPSLLHEAVERVLPEKIVLFAVSPTVDEVEMFLHQLAGMVKYVITHQNGLVAIDHLAASLAQTRESIQCGLDWLEAKGSIRQKIVNDESQISIGGKTDSEKAVLAYQRLEKMLAEVHSYRSYYKHSGIEAIFSE